jgi:mRNA interferase MazF
MVPPTTGTVVLLNFPFSDLSSSKLRPAVVLASADRGDWLLCQITGNPYGDVRAVEIKNTDFLKGSLQTTSYARPGKLFTAHQRLVISSAGVVKKDAFDRVLDAVIALLHNKPPP